MLRALTALGHCVDLLSYPQGADLEIAGVRHMRSLRLPVGRVRAGASLAKLLLDVPFMVEAWWHMLRGGYDVVHAVEEAAHLASPLARLIGLPLICDVDSSIPDQLRYSGFARRGPLLWAAERLEHQGAQQRHRGHHGLREPDERCSMDRATNPRLPDRGSTARRAGGDCRRRARGRATRRAATRVRARGFLFGQLRELSGRRVAR